MRITDVCTRLEDAICVAALFRCWLRMLYRLRLGNQRWRRYSSMLLSENRWLAQRYGTEKGLVDFAKGKIVPFRDLVEELLELIREDAEHFDCVDEVAHARVIRLAAARLCRGQRRGRHPRGGPAERGRPPDPRDLSWNRGRDG